MGKVSSSSLRKQMREDDPRRWLEWTLSELIDELQGLGHPGALERVGELKKMQATVAGWPADMHPPEETERLIAKVDELRRELDDPPKQIVHQGEIVREEGTTYSRADPSAGARRRSTRPAVKQDLSATVAHFPPRKRESFTAKRPAQPAKKDDPMPPTQRGMPSDVTPPPPTVRGVPAGYQTDEPEAPQRQLAVRPPSHPPVKPARDPVKVVRRRARGDSLPPPSHAELGQFLIEHLDESGALDPRLVMLRDEASPAAEAYRTLFYRLGATSDARRLMVTTSSDEEDGSICAANFALTVALGCDDRVLLIETNFKQPRLANHFGFVPTECFGRRLAKHRREPTAPWRIAALGGTNLSLLVVDPHQPTTPALDAQALSEVVGRFEKAGYGYVILAGPPATPDSDARYVSRCAEGVLMAVNDKQSRSRRLRKGVKLLEAPVLGMVMLQQ